MQTITSTLTEAAILPARLVSANIVETGLTLERVVGDIGLATAFNYIEMPDNPPIEWNSLRDTYASIVRIVNPQFDGSKVTRFETGEKNRSELEIKLIKIMNDGSAKFSGSRAAALGQALVPLINQVGCLILGFFGVAGTILTLGQNEKINTYTAKHLHVELPADMITNLSYIVRIGNEQVTINTRTNQALLLPAKLIFTISQIFAAISGIGAHISSMLSLGLSPEINKKANAALCGQDLLTRPMRAFYCVIIPKHNEDDNYNSDTTARSHIQAIYAEGIRRAKSDSKPFTRHVSSRLTFAVLGIAAVVSQVAEAFTSLLGLLTMVPAASFRQEESKVVYSNKKPKVIKVKEKEGQVKKRTEASLKLHIGRDISMAIRGIINPQQFAIETPPKI